MSRHVFTEEQKAWCRARASMGRPELRRDFNERFELDLSLQQMQALCKRLGLKNGRHGAYLRGCRPGNALPVGTHVKTAAGANHVGYWKLKVAEPRDWRYLHLLVWEQANGPIPEQTCIAFRDGDEDNVVLDNLVAFDRREFAILNSRFGGLKGKPPELREAIISTVRLIGSVAKLRGAPKPGALKKISRALGINYNTLKSRVNRGMSIERAIGLQLCMPVSGDKAMEVET